VTSLAHLDDELEEIDGEADREGDGDRSGDDDQPADAEPD
jgi:hypothetical protein